MSRCQILVVLDRDGVLNRLLGDPLGGKPDSPMCASEVELFPWVPAVLRRLTEAGFGLAVATNQPAWAKGKASQAALLEVHERVLREAQSAGGQILSSHVCWHRAEDSCSCRKPNPGLLREAFRSNPGYDPRQSWMVGDRATDVFAGVAMSMYTALLGPSVPGDTEVLSGVGVKPCYWGTDLRDFADFLVGDGKELR